MPGNLPDLRPRTCLLFRRSGVIRWTGCDQHLGYATTATDGRFSPSFRRPRPNPRTGSSRLCLGMRSMMEVGIATGAPSGAPVSAVPFGVGGRGRGYRLSPLTSCAGWGISLVPVGMR
jgi:hypothetical protein